MNDDTFPHANIYYTLIKRSYRISFLSIIISCLFSVTSTIAGIQDSYNNRAEMNKYRIGIVTGSPYGIYSKIGQNIIQLFNTINSKIGYTEKHLRIINQFGRGSLGNIEDLIGLKFVDFSIVQSDVMSFLVDDPDYNWLKQHISFVTTLFKEEVHLVARRKYITDIYQLNDKFVAVDLPGSGSSITAKVIFDRLGIHPRFVPMPIKQAVDELKSNLPSCDGLTEKLSCVDAAFYVIAKPTDQFGQTNISTKDGIVHDLHFIPILKKMKKLNSDEYVEFSEYGETSFESTDYTNIVRNSDTPVPTLDVTAVLAAFNWENANSENIYRLKNENQFIQNLFDNIDQIVSFDETLHKKWCGVKLETDVSGWRRSAAAQKWLDTNPTIRGSICTRRQ